MFGSRWQPMRLLFAGVGILVAMAPLPLGAQVLHGVLLDATSDGPVTGARVGLVDNDSIMLRITTTDSLGYFLLEGPATGAYRLRAERIGYPTTISVPLNVSAGDTIEVEFRIAAGAVLLDPVVVTARRRPPPPMIRDFYRRAERSISGTFITRADVERAHPFRTSDLLRRIPGLQIIPLRLGGGSAVLMRGGCSPLVVIDGVRLRDVRSIDFLVQPLELEGLEVYRSAAQVPVEYGGLQTGCGAIMIWTRHGP